MNLVVIFCNITAQLLWAAVMVVVAKELKLAVNNCENKTVCITVNQNSLYIKNK